VKRTFCPPAECYDAQANADCRFGKPLPSLSSLIENGCLAALNFPISMNAGLAKALGVMLKLDFERAVLNRVPQMEKNREAYFVRFSFFATNTSILRRSGRASPPVMKNSSVCPAAEVHSNHRDAEHQFAQVRAAG